MFDIAWTELLVIVVIAILVVGPKELPAMLRTFGRTLGTVRRTAREFQSTFNDALREAERQAKLDEVKKDLESVRRIDPAADLKKGLDEAKASLDGKVEDKAVPEPDVVPLKGERPAPVQPPAPPSASTSSASPPQGERPAALPPSEGAPGMDREGEGEAPRAAAGGERR